MRLIDEHIIEKLFDNAMSSSRQRSHLLLHDTHDDKVQRLIIAMVLGSYVEPHYHELPHQWEMFVVIQGSVKVVLYNEDGSIKHSFYAGPQHKLSVVEFSPGDIHSVECISERAIMLEVKEGPFDINYAKTFPHWGL